MHKRLGLLSMCLLLLAGCQSTAQPQLVIEEHLLTAAPDISTDQLVFHFAGGDQEQILARTQAYRDFHQQVSDYNSRMLAGLGYRLAGFQEGDHTYSQIYRGDTLVAGDVVFMGPISVSSSGSDFISLVDLPDGQYQFTRSGLERRGLPPDRLPYVYVGDRLLSIEVSGAAAEQSLIKVFTDDVLAYQSNFHNVSVYAAFDGPWSYAGHWALVLIDAAADAAGEWRMLPRIVQDGRDLNTVRNYEQSFQFAVLDGQPFYFFQREGRIGISFAGRDAAPTYDEIPHYQCCSGSLLNPGTSMNMVWFFARRAASWYYVEAYVPSALP